MQVEVCIQECFEQGASDQETQRSPSLPDTPTSLSGSITPETWEFWFRRWLEELQPEFSPVQSYELSLRFTSDREIQSLNAQYRHQDKPTDVLAFAALETDSPITEDMEMLPLYLGDIVVSIETATRQANQQNHSLETELAWLSTHGLLHLLGWDHPDETSLNCMLEQQRVLLQKVGFLL